MTNTSIQQSLIELEQNLINLNSAREQVQNVTEGTENLINVVRELITTIEGLSGQFDPSEYSFEDKIGESLNMFSKSINDGAGKAITKYEKLSDDNITTFQSAVKALEKKLTDSLFKFENSINNGASKATETFEDISNKNLSAVENTVTKMNEFVIHLSEAEKQIRDFDLTKSNQEIKLKLDDIDNKLSQFEVSYNQKNSEIEKIVRFNRLLLYAISAIGFIGVLVILNKLL